MGFKPVLNYPWFYFACYSGVIFNPYGIYTSIWYYELYKYFGTKARDTRMRHTSRTSTVHYILNSVHIWNDILYTVPYGKDYGTVPYKSAALIVQYRRNTKETATHALLK